MRCGPDWLWTYNGRLLWMDGMLYLTAFGHGLDCQTIMVMDFWASMLLDYKSYIGHRCYHLPHQAVCEVLQGVVDI